MSNTVDLINDAKTSAVEDSTLYARAINLLQFVSDEMDGNSKVSTLTLRKINKLLDDSYEKALESK